MTIINAAVPFGGPESVSTSTLMGFASPAQDLSVWWKNLLVPDRHILFEEALKAVRQHAAETGQCEKCTCTEDFSLTLPYSPIGEAHVRYVLKDCPVSAGGYLIGCQSESVDEPSDAFFGQSDIYSVLFIVSVC